MSNIVLQVKAERATRAQHSKNTYATGYADLVVDGQQLVRLFNFRLSYAPRNNKWFINPPSRSVEQVNSQTGVQEKRWLDQWQLWPANKEAREQWMNYIMQETFRQVPEPTKALEDLGYQAPQAAPQAAPQQPSYAAPPQQAAPQQQAPQQPVYAAPPGGYQQTPQAAPPPQQAPQQAPQAAYVPPGAPPQNFGPPAGAPPPQQQAPVYAAPPGQQAAPGAPPMMPPGNGPAFAPQAPQAPQAPRGPSPTAHAPQNPSFPLPPA